MPRASMLRLLLIWLAGVLVIGLAGPAAVAKSLPAASGPAPTATQIRFDVIHNTGGISLPNTPGSAQGALVYVVHNESFEVDLSFWGLGENGTETPLPLSWNKTTTVTLSADGQRGSWSVDVAAAARHATVTVTLPTPANGVSLHAEAPGPKHTLVKGDSPTFEVLIDSTAGRSIGRTIDADGCNATPTDEVCADLVPPAGGFTGGSLLARGVCDDNGALTDCRGMFVQALAAFGDDPDATGARTNPATLIMKCDKTQCGGGAIKSNELTVELVPGGPVQTAQPCPAKGVVGASQTFCVDYVQSTRDNAGDTILYLLFVEDAKVRFP